MGFKSGSPLSQPRGAVRKAAPIATERSRAIAPDSLAPGGLLLEIGERRHTAVGREMVDDLRQRGRELVQELLLAHAGPLRKLVEHVGPERRAELARLDRLIGSVADPGIDLGGHSARGELADEIIEPE